MIKTLMSKGNKHTLRDMAWISRTLIYASYKHQVSHVGYGSSSCTQYDRLKRSFLSSSILQLCLKACYVNLGTRKLNDGDSNSDICVYVDSKSAMSFEWCRAWRRREVMKLELSCTNRSAHVAEQLCSLFHCWSDTQTQSPSASEEEDNEQSMPGTRTVPSNFTADNTFLPSKQCRMHLCRLPQREGWWWRSSANKWQRQSA